jgi:uncharacterized protein YjiS (DUF1127 family)
MVSIMSNRINTISGCTTTGSRTPGLIRRLDRGVTAVLDAMYKSRQRIAERHLLASLDDRMLKDLGLSRCDVENEIRKRFWQG